MPWLAPTGTMLSGVADAREGRVGRERIARQRAGEVAGECVGDDCGIGLRGRQ